ncbi:MAG: succinate--CoA ligase subunit beta [Promicromonosporaceae bacterium]|nr:succinate--CoA ligase subunit beta [Promicromonosporaceae bacterium]
MNLFEHQARDLFEMHQVRVPRGIVARTPEQARVAAAELGCPGRPVLVKAQAKTRGLGKAEGIRQASTPEEAADHAAKIIGGEIDGHLIHRVLLTETVDVAHEFNLSLMLDRAERRYVALCSAQTVARVPIDPLDGLNLGKAYEIVEAAGLPENLRVPIVTAIVKLWRVFREEDATLVEASPLAIDYDGEVIVLGAAMSLDERAAFRHRSHAQIRADQRLTPAEAKAKALGLSYTKLDGEVGVIGNGAGLVMATLDAVKLAGQQFDTSVGPANYLDLGVTAGSHATATGLSIVLDDPQVKAVFVNVFGGITGCDKVARGIVDALDARTPGAHCIRSGTHYVVGQNNDGLSITLGDSSLSVPVVVRLEGNGVDLARTILRHASLPNVYLAESMSVGAITAAELAAVATFRETDEAVDISEAADWPTAELQAVG